MVRACLGLRAFKDLGEPKENCHWFYDSRKFGEENLDIGIRKPGCGLCLLQSNIRQVISPLGIFFSSPL